MADQFGAQLAFERAGHRVTYAKLESDSNRLANFLREEGVSTGSMVGLFTDDPLQVIMGILGVLKAGAVFVPLDPTFPTQRLLVMSDQASPGWYLTSLKHLEKLRHVRGQSNGSAKVICLDGPGPGSESNQNGLKVLAKYGNYDRDVRPAFKSDPDSACSIYFTSGSTGKPKAILGRLKGIDHYVRWEIGALGIVPGTRVSQLASPSFDGFLKDAFVPLCAGGVVCAPENRNVIVDVSRLVDWLDIERVEVLHCVPSLFRALINQGLNSNYFEALKYVVLAGEPLLPADVKRWMEIFGERIRLANLYGPTETTILKVFHFVKPEDIAKPSIPLGKPIAGAAVLIMDPALQPCHEGAFGEIYIRTPYCSLGYYGEPELTREVFIQNPFNDDPADIIHKTGDYGRLLEDGSLEFLGRRDQQVKVRGVRIELGEIENLLRSNDAVADVAVVDRDDSEGNKFLVAYVKLTNGTGSESLREYLAERLPETMLPSAIVELEQLPRTLNGKIDRKALPALEKVHAERDASEFIPRGPIEEIVAGIWCDVLRLTAVGRRSNFFDLGGHSLLATQVLLRVRNSLQVDLPIRSMFEAPTIEQFSQLVGIQINEGRQNALAPIEIVSRAGDLPLSFAQQRLWFQEQRTPGTAAFHIALQVTLNGPLNAAALEQTFAEIIRRHENLRTSFPLIDGDLVQVISPPSGLPIPIIDLHNLNQPEQQNVSNKLAEAEFGRPFDLETGPLTRVVLIRHSAEEHTIICALHHLISDGWSKGVLVKEISTVYEAFCRAEPSPLPELPIQYVDFAAWQRQQLQGEVLESELAYWKENLADAPLLLQLATDRPRPPVQTYRGAAEPFVLSQRLTQQLKVLASQRGVTLFMTLLAAFQTLLYRYTSQEDIVVGTSVANRERPEIEGLIGFFVNMVALRTDCSDNPQFQELLEQVQESTFKAYAHQGVPFERLVQELQPIRNPSYPPLFQVVFSFQNQPTLTELTLSGLTLSFPPVEITTSQFDLLLDVSESKAGLTGALQYNPDLFDRTTIAQMAQHFRSLLEGIVSDPAQRLSELPLLSEEEQAESLETWNQTAAEYPQDTCIHELFESRAKAEPDSIAAVFRDDHLSYAELNRRANQLARYLQRAGVKIGDLVGICLEHSLEELIALLGVLKAGAGYMPLDPEHPTQRLSFMLADAGASVVLTQQGLGETLLACGAQPICLDSDWPLLSQESDANVNAGASAQNTAYVIYTSGSTGEPKGVAVSHRALVNYVWWAKDVYLQNESLGFALYSSLAFDLTVTSIYVPLITGNKILISHWAGKDAPLEEILNDQQTGVWKLTPSHLTLIKDWDNRQTSVKRMIVGGEALATELARQICESCGGQVEIFNEYGPTEATVGCMLYQFDARKDSRPSVPIGRPAANVQLYILDKWLKPTAANIPGELYIAGPGLAHGYLNRPELTAERFIANPFASGQRMYRTGDLCRRLSCGDLEYLGRKDEQVKFHGYRVELNEIRWALKKHPQVRDSAVVISKDKLGHDLMVAYYVSRQELEVAQLRDFLSDILIAETIPNFFVHLSKLPLTLNGKINYEALPSLEEAKRKLQRTYTSARTPQEKILAAIWSEVLSIERVGIDENFFALGGHSLLATQIIHRINQNFHVDLPMRVIFDEPTIAGLSLLVEETLIEQLEATTELA
jgi:amino acid adenylation domain-containing protein